MKTQKFPYQVKFDHPTHPELTDEIFACWLPEKQLVMAIWFTGNDLKPRRLSAFTLQDFVALIDAGVAMFTAIGTPVEVKDYTLQLDETTYLWTKQV